MLKVYCVHPISGMAAEDVFKYYDNIKVELGDMGYDVLTPMYGKDYLRNEIKMKAGGYDNP